MYPTSVMQNLHHAEGGRTKKEEEGERTLSQSA
jgi:hypothetical protein